LKRATGIPDHPEKNDAITGNGIVHVNTTDLASAELLAELFHKIYYGNHRASYYEKRKDRPQMKDTVRVYKLENSCFEVEAWIPPEVSRSFRLAVEELTDQHIAPANRRGR
jgi:hypothetical protein